MSALAAVGDSITAGFGASSGGYPTLLAADATNNVSYIYASNRGVSGNKVSNLVSQAAALDATLPAQINGRRFILTVLIGLNDFLNGQSIAAFEAALASYLDARRSAGWYVVAATLLPAGDVGYNAWRNTVNTDILATWLGLHADAIWDIGNDPTMGPDSAPNNATLYQPDKEHPTNLGQSDIEISYAAKLNSIILR